MLIGIDASRYKQKNPTGVEVYSKEIIEGLIDCASKSKNHALRLYTRESINALPHALQRVLPYRRLWTQRHLSREMKVHPPDVLFVPSHVLPLRHPKRSVVMIHDVAFREYPKAYSPLQWLYLHWSTRFAVKRASLLLVPSQSTQRDIMKYYGADPQKIVTIPHGFRPPTLQISASKCKKILKSFHLTPNAPFIFFVGRLETKKNLERLLEAFSIFKQKFPNWKLVLGGSRGVGFPHILKTAQRLNLLQAVLMLGYLTEEEKIVLYEQARIFAFPSLSEGFGFPILEAAYHRVPILASAIPSLQELKPFVDVFVDPQNILSIADGLEQLAVTSTPSKRALLKSYSWRKNAQKVWDLLTQETPI